MSLHLLKLAVGAGSLDHLRAWAGEQSAAVAGGRGPVRITTRMAPRRSEELLAGGSLYWVVKGALQARQRIVGIEPFTDGAGVGRVHILLDGTVTAVRPRPCRPFQGWRYLRPQDAPPDFRLDRLDEAMPAAMRRELAELCLI